MRDRDAVRGFVQLNAPVVDEAQGRCDLSLGRKLRLGFGGITELPELAQAREADVEGSVRELAGPERLGDDVERVRRDRDRAAGTSIDFADLTVRAPFAHALLESAHL